MSQTAAVVLCWAVVNIACCVAGGIVWRWLHHRHPGEPFPQVANALAVVGFAGCVILVVFALRAEG